MNDENARLALFHAEKIGITEYVLNDDWMEYWSFFPGEGFRFIRYNVQDGTEYRDGFIPWNGKNDNRPVPAFLKTEDGATLYNYNCG